FLGNRFPAGVRSLLFQTIGLITLILGLQRALGTTNILILLVSVVLGGILGEFLHIEDGLAALGNLAQSRLGGGQPADDASDTTDRKPSLLSQGFVTASLIFCVGH